MEIKRYTEHFLCDAIKLAFLLGGENSTMSNGIGYADDFPLAPRERDMLGEDIRFIRVNGEENYEVGYVTEDTPTPDDMKLRRKSVYRVMFGRELRRARIAAGFSLEEVSRQTNLRVHSLERIEEGRWDFDTTVIGNILTAIGGTFKIV